MSLREKFTNTPVIVFLIANAVIAVTITWLTGPFRYDYKSDGCYIRVVGGCEYIKTTDKMTHKGNLTVDKSLPYVTISL